MVEQHRLEIATKIRELKDATSQRDKAQSNLQTRYERYQESTKKVRQQAEADISVSETFVARSWSQMTIAQQQVATANAQFDDMSKAIKSFEDAEIVVTRNMEAAQRSLQGINTSAGQHSSSNPKK